MASSALPFAKAHDVQKVSVLKLYLFLVSTLPFLRFALDILAPEGQTALVLLLGSILIIFFQRGPFGHIIGGALILIVEGCVEVAHVLEGV